MLSKGLAYEKLALQYLKRAGLKPIDINYRSRYGEIDLIMQDHEALVFVEVKFRKTESHGAASETITKSKQNKIIKTAALYLSQKNLWHLNSRFDVVAISPALTLFDNHRIQWYKAAFY
jgi:putative endonuclease